jgi:predicted PurR-regulated permease PerM
MDSRSSETWFFVVILALAIFVSWLILAPYLGVLILAGTLAYLFQPLYKKFASGLRYESLAAFLIIIIVVLIIFAPLAFFGVRIFDEAAGLYTSITAHGGFNFGTTLGAFIKKDFPSFPTADFAALNFNAYAQQGLNWLLQNFGVLFSGVAQIFFTAFLSLLGLFYFLKDGARLEKWLVGTLPLSPKYTEEIIDEMEAVASSVIKGTLLVAVIQGIVLGIGMFIFHIPDPTFWGALAIPVSVIPILGTWLVAIPAVGYLFFTGHTIAAAGLAIWSIVFVNLIYNLLTPRFIRRGLNLHPYLILLSVLGGIGLFGPIGFLIGPLILALLFALLKIYPRLVAGRAK